MGFKKGEGRPNGAGRKAGTPNKRTLEARAVVERLGFDPIEALVYWATGDWKKLGYDSGTIVRYTAEGAEYEEDRISPELRQKSTKDLMPYLYPQLKATELSLGSEAKQTIEDFIRGPSKQE